MKVLCGRRRREGLLKKRDRDKVYLFGLYVWV